jgi:gliding motility-associated-like protein
MKNRMLFTVFLLLLYAIGFTQDFSNKGTDFWLGYGYHVNMAGNPAGGGTQDMVLYFTSDKNANVVVEIPGVAYTASYTVAANQVTTSAPIPKTGTQDARISGVGTFDRGIHITSDVPIVAYAHIYNASVSGASLLFPTNTLGKDYYSVNFTQSSNAANANSFFFVVATEDNTSVDIIPSAATVNGLPVGVATRVGPLNKGQIYSVMGTVTGTLGTDLTGSRIKSVSSNGSAGCKKIAVFSGAGKMSIGGAGNASGSADNLFAQAFPAVAWGKKYLTVPTGTQPHNYYRVCVSDPTTVVKLNGTVLPASSLLYNFYYQFKDNNGTAAVPNLIEANKPILVAQYCTTQGVDGNPNTTPFGDPEMIYLSPVEQTINKITLYSASKYQILQSYVNVVIKKGGTSSFTIDGTTPTTSFQAHPQDAGYSYAVIPVGAGSHTLYSDTGFNAIAYGFGSAESYGYNAGTNVRDFTPVATFQNPYGRIDSAVTCVNTPLQFSVPLSFVPASIKWDFSGAPNILPNTTLGPITTVTADSTRTLNGQTLNYYSPGKTFTFSAANTSSLRDTIKLYTTSSTPDGCGSTDQVYSIPVIVKAQPLAKFSIASGGCVTDSVRFTDQSSFSLGTINRWLWNFGDGTTADLTSSAVPAKVYTTPASYTIKLTVASDIGCISDPTTQVIQQTAKPVAKFTTTAIKCAETNIVFTDASTTPTGTIAKWIWDLADGGSVITNTTNAAVTTKYSSDGTKAVSLKVESATGCQSDLFTPAFSINPQPQVNFGIPEVCLSDAFALFTDSTKISDGTEAQFKWSWNFNAGSPAVSPGPSIATSTVKNPQIKYNKSDNYKVSLAVTSKDGCVATLAQDFTVNGSIPKASFEFANAAPYCGTKPVQLKNTSTVDFGNVTKLEIYWDLVNNPTVKQLDDVPTPGKIYPHSYPDPSSAKQYTIKIVAYSGGSACSDFATKTITVYPQPKAEFTVSANQLCFGETVSFTDKSTSGSSAIANWAWDLAKGDVSTIQNPKKQFNDSGIFKTSMYFYNQDGCISDTASQQLIVYPNPKLVLKHKITVLIGATATLLPDFVYGDELQYLWTPATYLSSDTSVSPKTIPDDDITYKLTLTAKGGCSVSDTIFVRVLKGPEVPNVFSPNGDGINDTWKIKYLDGYVGATIDVYNRYGQLVYKGVGYDVEWDGTYNGHPLPVGTYYYIINPKNGRQVVKGSVTIIK